MWAAEFKTTLGSFARPCLKRKRKRRAEVVAQWPECLPHVWKCLGSIPSFTEGKGSERRGGKTIDYRIIPYSLLGSGMYALLNIV